MTSSTPSVFPAPVDAGQSTEAASISRPVRQETTDQSFDDFCRDANCAGEQGHSTGVGPSKSETLRKELETGNPVDGESTDNANVSEAGGLEGVATAVEQPDQKDETLPTVPVLAEVAAGHLPGSASAEAKSSPENVKEVPVRAVPENTLPASAGKVARDVMISPSTVETKVARDGEVSAANTKDVQERPIVPENLPSPKLARLRNKSHQAGKGAGGGKVFRENFAARREVAQETGEGNSPKHFLPIGKQIVEKLKSLGGTDTATQADPMKLSSRFSAQPSGMRSAHSPGPGDVSREADTQFLWKGWTNGGGELVSPAARISQVPGAVLGAVAPHVVSEVVPQATVHAPTPSGPVPTAWSAMEPKAALAPVGATIERMIVRGQEQISVTIRFEQGGSLSVKLGMNNGEIAARIQTDVAGLDNALRSGWSEFAQDWNGRGIKLATPIITANPHNQGQPEHNGPGHREGNPRGHEFSEAREERGSFQRDLGSRRRQRGHEGSTDHAPNNVSSNKGPADRIRSGLQTWA